MESFNVYTLNEANDWRSWFNKLPHEYKDAYYTPEYYSAYNSIENSNTICIVYQKNDMFAMYPFLKGCINELGYSLNDKYYDIQGAYGYNGVVANTVDISFLTSFKNIFLEWCNKENIVAEFVRFNPVSNNYNLSLWLEPVFLLDNVLIPLNSYDEVWKTCFHKKVREAVRKSNRQGLKYVSYDGNITTDDYFNEFVNIYYHMLDRNKADKSYYFSPEFFEQLKNELPAKTLFSFALLEGMPISTELILIGDVNAYAFLGGTLSDYYSYSPNTYIQDEIVKDLISRGIKFYNRGGGLTNEDAVYYFKKSFSIAYDSKFFIGKKIHNQKIYDEITNQWQNKGGQNVEKYSSRVLKYRY